QPHHVVAEITENSGCHGREHVRQIDAAFGDERAQCRQRRTRAGRKGVRALPRAAVDLGSPGDGAPNEIGMEANDRITPADRAPFDGFQQKTRRPRSRELEKRRYRSLKVRDQRSPHDLSLAARVAFGKSRGLWLDLHVSQAQFAPSPAPPLTTWFSAL